MYGLFFLLLQQGYEMLLKLPRQKLQIKLNFPMSIIFSKNINNIRGNQYTTKFLWTTKCKRNSDSCI